MLNRFLLLSALFAPILAAQNPAPVRSWSDTEKLEATLDSHPDDLDLRIQLLRYYTTQGTASPDRAKPLRRKHILWMIQNHPEHRALSEYAGAMDPAGNPLADPDGFAECSAAWQKALSVKKPLFDVFVNAITFYRTGDPERARRVADEGLKLYPGNARITDKKGMLLAFSIAGVKTVEPWGTGITFDEGRPHDSQAERDRHTLETSADPNLLGGAAHTLTSQINGLFRNRFTVRAQELEGLIPRLYERAIEYDPNGQWMFNLMMAYQEFAGLAAASSEKIANLQKALAAAPTPFRSVVLVPLAEAYFDSGDMAKAAGAAKEALEPGQGNPIVGAYLFQGNILLGRIALVNGDPKEASRRLVAASHASGYRFSGPHGPQDGGLAGDLLAAGERDSVLTYLDSLHQMWQDDGGKLDNWIATVREGGTPNFAPPGQFPKNRYVGRPAPEMRLKDLTGAEVALSDFKGKVVLVDFWGTWCGPCRDEMPEFQKIHQELGAKDMVVLAVDGNEPAETVAKYMQEQKLTLPVLLAQDTDVVKRFSVTAFPTTFVVDKNGLVADVIVGGGTNTGPRLQALIEKGRAGAPPAAKIPVVTPTSTTISTGATATPRTPSTRPPTPAATAEDYFRDAVRQHNAKDYASAIQSLDRALALRPDWVEAVVARADNNDHAKHYEEARAGFSRAIELDPKRSASYDGRGLALSSLGRHADAIPDFNRVIELNPQAAPAYNNRGWAYLETGRLDEALADLNKCLELNPANTRALINRAHLFESRKEYAEAIADYESVLRVDPSNTPATSQRASDLRRMENTAAAQTGVVPGHPIYREGKLEVPPTFTWDMDEGAVRPGAGFWYEAVNATTRYIMPRGGVLMAAMGSQAVDYGKCAGANLSAARIDLGTLKKGDFVCVQTSAGRIAAFRYENLISKSPERPDILTLVISFTIWSNAAIASGGLAPPRLLSPADGSVFGHYPRTTTVVWSEVPGASEYVVEWDYKYDNTWASENDKPSITIRTKDPVATFQFVGAQPGRWRVWALDADGKSGPKSEWRELRYTR